MVIRLRQVSEDFEDKESYFSFYFRSLDFKIWASILIVGYISILIIVLASVYLRGQLNSEIIGISIFFFFLFLLVIYLLFISPILFLKNAWEQYLIFDFNSLKLVSSKDKKNAEILYRDIYSISFTESLNAVAIFYKTNDWRINKVIGLTGVNYDDFIKIAELLKGVRSDLNIVKRKSGFF